MKKILIAAVLAFTGITSAFAFSVGARADVDLGLGKVPENAESKADDFKRASIGESFGLWVEIPIIDIKVVSLGIRPEVDYNMNSGLRYITSYKKDSETVYTVTDTTTTVSSIDIPIFVTANVNLIVFKVGAGAGAYVTFPLNNAQSTVVAFNKTEATTTITISNTPIWGFCGFANAGFRLGPGFLMVDARLMANSKAFQSVTTTPVTKKELVSDLFTRFDLDFGIAYEISF